VDNQKQRVGASIVTTITIVLLSMLCGGLAVVLLINNGPDADGPDADGFDSDRDRSRTPIDCDDNDVTVYPGAIEICDGKDNDCDKAIDEGITDSSIWYRDADGDGYGGWNLSDETSQCRAPIGYVAVSGDCDDFNAAIDPGTVDVCDGIDNNCDGADGVDEDKDGAYTCPRAGGVSADRNDNDSNICGHEDSKELCSDGIDNDSDGRVDVRDTKTCGDNDGDGFPNWFDGCPDMYGVAEVEFMGEVNLCHPFDGCPAEMSDLLNLNSTSVDSDEDGVVDFLDACPHTPEGTRVISFDCIDDMPLYKREVRKHRFGCPRPS